MANEVPVSLITVCYNSSATIKDTIESVLSQTYSNWEHIIVDGGSSDDTVKIIQSYEREYAGRLRLFQGPDKGIYDAMNKGIAAANGIIIGIINSDDWYESNAVEKVVEAYNNKVDASDLIITGGLNRIRDGIVIYTQIHNEITFNGLKKGMPLQHPAVFVTKSVYDRIGVFDISFPHIADYDFVWRCFADGKVKFIFVNSVVSNMREGGASDRLSWKHIWSRTKERYRLRSKYIPRWEALFSSAEFLGHEMVFQISKKILGTSNIQKVYSAKKKINHNIKRIIYSVDKAIKKVPCFRRYLVYSYHYARRFVFGAFRVLEGYKTGFLTYGVRLSPCGKNCYFGYYDKVPFSPDGSHYLFHMINGTKAPKVGEKASICYATSAKNYEVIGQTLAWNSQQGAMLRFVNDHLIAYNNFDEDRKQYIAMFYDTNTRKNTIIDYPLYDISDDGKAGLSIDFERLNIDAEGYGYIQLQNKTFDKNTYIRYVDLTTGNSKVIITLKSLCEEYPISGEATFAYFNHLEFNPSADRFIFILRYIVDQKRISRLFSADLEGNDIRLLADDEMVSHCTWKDDTHVTLWCKLNGINDYYTITDDDEAEAVKLGLHTPKEDGHPTYNKDRTLMITDTYPDKAEYRHLILYDVIKDQSRDIARLYAPVLLHGPLRCDFHPRWHPNMEQVVIDSVHEGYRGLYLVDIKEKKL